MKNLILILLISPFTLLAQKNIESESSVDLIQKGIEKHDNKEYYEAIQKFKKVSVNDTNYTLAQFETALSYLALEEYVFAQKILINLIKYEVPYDSKALVYKMLAQTYEGEKKYDLAIKTYDEALKIYPKNHNLHFSKGITLEKYEKYQEALESYKNAVRCNANHPGSHLRLGVIAANESRFVESYFSLMSFLMLEPKSERAAGVVSMLEELANGSYNPEPKNIKLSEEGDEFEDINLFFKNQVALTDKYKAKFSYSTAYAKQFHLILSNVKYNKDDKGFWTQMYMPLFLDIFEGKTLDNMILFSLQSVNNDKVQKKVNSKRSAINSFIDVTSLVWAKRMHDQYMEYEGKIQKVYAIYDKEGLIVGQVDAEGQPDGKWFYYHTEGNLRLTATYKNGKKTGTWTWRNYFTNEISEVTNFTDGLIDGESNFFYPSGELSEKRSYDQGKIIDTVYTYYRNGQISEKIALKDEKRNGLNIGFYENGAVKFKLYYKDNLAEGKFENFYPTGQLQTEMSFVADKINGKRKAYFPDGQIESEYTYDAKGSQGPFIIYFPNGQIKEKGEMKDGNYLGEVLAYYSNGLPFSKGKYDESGKENGTIEFFDAKGKKYQEFTYKKGNLEQIKNFNEKGELSKTIDKSGKKIQFEAINPESRTIKTSGLIVDEKRSGLWKYYDNYGNLESEENYIDGKIEGTTTAYFPNGKINYKYEYKDGSRNGLYLEYNKFGELVTEGLFKDNERSNDWYEYFNDGSLSSEYSYKNGELHGYQKTYAVSGKLFSYDIFDEGRIIASVYLDTAGNEMQRFGELNGLVQIKGPANTYHRFEANYKNGYIDGKSQWFESENQLFLQGQSVNGRREGNWKLYYPSGKLKKTYDYKNGDLHGKMIEYHENGQIYNEDNYIADELNGEYKYYYENGKLEFLGNYMDNKRHGKLVSYSINGELQQIRYYDRGVLLSYSYLDKDGKEVEPIKIGLGTTTFTTYYQSGKKSILQTRMNGELHGKYIKYYPNEKIAEEEVYELGDRNGLSTEYYENGNKKLETTYKFDEKHGVETAYHSNGKIKYTIDYVFGKRHGVKKEYDSTGKLIKTTYFYNDEVTKII